MEKSDRIPFKRMNFMGAYEAVKPFFENGFIGLGNEVFKLESELAEYVGGKYAIATDSCTSALFISLKYEDAKEVSIPSMTVPLVPNACSEAGAKVKFNGETDWVGSAYQIGGTNVYDSAHQLQRGQYNQLTKENPDAKLCFSFYPTKTVGSADGGAIITNDEKFASWARSAITYGRDQEAKYQNSWDYDVVMTGYKRHYTNLQAAICREQLSRLDETNAERQEIRDKYNAALGYNNVSDYLYRINVHNRDGFIEYANKRGVECGVHFKPLHLMTPFKDFPMDEADKAKVEEEYAHTVSLPFFTDMTDEEVFEVIYTVKDYEDLHSPSR